jgi:hypothetical protein
MRPPSSTSKRRISALMSAASVTMRRTEHVPTADIGEFFAELLARTGPWIAV